MYSCGWRGRMHKCRAACRVSFCGCCPCCADKSRCSVLCCVLEGSGVVLLFAMDITCACVSLSLSHMEQWTPSPSRAHLWSLCSYE